MTVYFTLYNSAGRAQSLVYVKHPNAIERWDKIVAAIRAHVDDVASTQPWAGIYALCGRRGDVDTGIELEVAA
jgi:hypothetical protein